MFRISRLDIRVQSRHRALACLLALAILAPAFSWIGSAQADTGTAAQTSVSLPSVHSVLTANGRAVRYELFPGQPGKPTYVTFNGLIYNQRNWDPFLKELNKTGATILRYSFSADPESLALGDTKSTAPRFSVAGVSDEVLAVLDDAHVDRAVLLALSFGSIGVEFAIRHPERVERVVLMAPMIVPNDVYDTAGSATRAYLENIRSVWGEAAYEAQWSLLMEPTVRALTYRHVSLLSGFVPKELTIQDVVDGIIEKIKATRHFDLRDYTKTNLPRVDLLLAGEEEEPIFRDQNDFWEKLPVAHKGGYIVIRQSAHALPATAPEGTLKALTLLEASDGSEAKPHAHLELSPKGELAPVPH